MSQKIFIHRYVAFRVRLAHFSLVEFAGSLKNSMEIIALVFGPALIGLLARAIAL